MLQRYHANTIFSLNGNYIPPSNTVLHGYDFILPVIVPLAPKHLIVLQIHGLTERVSCTDSNAARFKPKPAAKPVEQVVENNGAVLASQLAKPVQVPHEYFSDTHVQVRLTFISSDDLPSVPGE